MTKMLQHLPKKKQKTTTEKYAELDDKNVVAVAKKEAKQNYKKNKNM